MKSLFYIPLWLLLFPLLSSCTGGSDLTISNPCDPLYVGDEICLADVTDTGLAPDDGGFVEGADSGSGVSGDIGDVGGEDSSSDRGTDGHDSGSCQCFQVSPCCDGCHPVQVGRPCDNDGLPCTEHRCSEAGTCELEIAPDWCLVDGFCHHTQTDPLHCGTCGNECEPKEQCVDGVCQPVCDDGSCTPPCAPGLTECGGSCVSLQKDPHNCGECGLACGPTGSCIDGVCTVPVSGITLNPATLTLSIDESSQLTATIAPANATDQSLIWTSSAPAVAVVNENGLVTGLSSGNGIISVLTASGAHTATCQVTVITPVTGVSVNPTALSLLPGEQATLTATTTPPDGDNQTVTWASTNEGVATVSPAGQVEAVAPGNTTITVTTQDGNHQAHCETTVVKTQVTGLTVTPPAITLIKGASGVQLQVTIEPEDATDQRVLWSSSNGSVVAVDQTGVITGLAAGEATITATTLSGSKAATCVVTVRVPVTGIAVTPDSLVIPPGHTEQLTAIISPDDASDTSVTWASSDESIATVSPTSLISSHTTGHAIITARSNDGGHTATVNVQVKISVTGVAVEPTTMFLMPGETGLIEVAVHPPDATEPGVMWSSTNGAVATVDHTGLVTGGSTGEITITATALDGDFTGSCTVNVGAWVTGVTVEPAAISLKPGDTELLTATIAPLNATDDTVNWTSADPAVAAIDTAGRVTGVTIGETTITVTTNDGGFNASTAVQVGEDVTGITLTPSKLVLEESGSEHLVATITPHDAANKTVIWTSDNPGVATVDDTGQVMAAAPGEAAIKVTTIDGGFSAVCTVIVVPYGYTLIPAGTFTMGSPPGELGHDANETQHQVTITRSFLMKVTPVTQDEWQTRMDGASPSQFTSCGDNCPVESVSWHMALAYANTLSAAEGLPLCYNCTGVHSNTRCSLNSQYPAPQECPGYRLPTEAEWEYAARAGSTAAFHTGAITHATTCSNMNAAGWYASNSDKLPHPVGGKAPNDWGLYDMHGSVWEWVWDWYGSSLGSRPAIDPCGPSAGLYRCVRGGAWNEPAGRCRAGFRSNARPDFLANYLGFRLARTM